MTRQAPKHGVNPLRRQLRSPIEPPGQHGHVGSNDILNDKFRHYWVLVKLLLTIPLTILLLVHAQPVSYMAGPGLQRTLSKVGGLRIQLAVYAVAALLVLLVANFCIWAARHDLVWDASIGRSACSRSDFLHVPLVLTDEERKRLILTGGVSRRPHKRKAWFALRLLSAVVKRMLDHRRVTRSRNALPTTLTEESAMAAAAMIGESKMPKVGYRMPAAIGMPAAL